MTDAKKKYGKKYQDAIIAKKEIENKIKYMEE